MQSLNMLKFSLLRLPSIGSVNAAAAKRFKRCSPCEFCAKNDDNPCFDIKNVTIERGSHCHSKLIRSFLYSQYWPREPTISSLWMDLNSPYLEVLTDQYSSSGERFLAFEHIQRTSERKLIGVAVCNRIEPWQVEELDQWANYTTSKPEKQRMYFCAHCLKSPNLYNKYNVPYIYEVDVLGTAADVTGHGVGTLLLKSVLKSAEELRDPLVQVVSVSNYMSKICVKCGMKPVWSMDFTEFLDLHGQRVFFPRTPHREATIYIKYHDPKKAPVEPCKPPF